MKKIIQLAAVAVMTISLVACASGPTQTLANANKAINAASSANSAVKKVNNEWRDTGKLIKSAKKAKDKGDYDVAVKLAKKAKNQANNAMAQYKSQKNAKPRI